MFLPVYKAQLLLYFLNYLFLYIARYLSNNFPTGKCFIEKNIIQDHSCSRYGPLHTCKYNLWSISKLAFDTICQQHLPLLVDRITLLCLSKIDDTPGQINQFYDNGFTLDHFTHVVTFKQLSFMTVSLS